MLKEEFEARIERTIPLVDFEKINHVYTWHPSIRNTDGKDQIAALYRNTVWLSSIR